MKNAFIIRKKNIFIVLYLADKLQFLAQRLINLEIPGIYEKNDDSVN